MTLVKVVATDKTLPEELLEQSGTQVDTGADLMHMVRLFGGKVELFDSSNGERLDLHNALRLFRDDFTHQNQ